MKNPLDSFLGETLKVLSRLTLGRVIETGGFSSVVLLKLTVRQLRKARAASLAALEVVLI